MCKFLQVTEKYIESCDVDVLYYILKIQQCYESYSKYLQDDFAQKENVIYLLKKTIPYFWIITDYEKNFMGFVYLDNFIGNSEKTYSAELTTCFVKQAWGNFTKYSAKLFLKKAFDELNLYKIKALVYPQNFRAKTLLKSSGFEYETTLKAETIRNHKMQDVDVFAIYRNYYYKDEVNYD